MGDGRMLFSFYLISYYIIRQSGGLAYEGRVGMLSSRRYAGAGSLAV